jgi:hypothetical protein
MFVDVGARAYVGTLWDVGNDTATRAAKTFYTKALKDGNLLSAFLRNAQANDAEEGRQRAYLVGLHFSSLQKPEARSDEGIFGALMHSFTLSSAMACRSPLSCTNSSF